MDKDLGKDSLFISKLHEEDYFDLVLFDAYIYDCENLDCKAFATKNDLRGSVAEIIDIFEYTLMRLVYHFDSNDLSQIINYVEISTHLAYIDSAIRKASQSLISKID